MDTILDKENFKLEDLLDEDEIIQECKALNTRLINLYVLSNTVSLCCFFISPRCILILIYILFESLHLLILF